jgi:geranylgeranyl diphosphate synthase type I
VWRNWLARIVWDDEVVSSSLTTPTKYMPPIFKTYKSLIDKFLLNFLDAKKESLAAVNDFGPDLLGRIKKMVVAGKTIRGSLVLFAYCFTNSKPSEDAIKLAAAMELMQTALVIHDDIMDKDDVRRGIPSFHKQYNSESLAMCAGDVLFFLAFELLGSIKTDELTLGRIIRLVGREYQNVGIAQMADISHSAKTKVDVLSLYTNKTARYTFAIPLMLGATLAGTTKEMLRYLESYGVATGVLFQIQDDKLDKENNLFSQDDVRGFTDAAHESLKRLPVASEYKKVLQDLLDFVVTRSV